jgi:hypothetical protein
VRNRLPRARGKYMQHSVDGGRGGFVNVVVRVVREDNEIERVWFPGTGRVNRVHGFPEFCRKWAVKG